MFLDEIISYIIYYIGINIKCVHELSVYTSMYLCCITSISENFSVLSVEALVDF